MWELCCVGKNILSVEEILRDAEQAIVIGKIGP